MSNIDETVQSAATQQVALPTPAEIRAFLDEYVVGQDDAKRVLAVAVYNHYKRINYNLMMSASPNERGIELGKSNILMIGPTGSGKTYLASTLARILNVPIAMADATTLLGTANVSKEIDAILIKLIQSANNDIKLAERGIIYIDEIDKLAKRDPRSTGESVQQALLKVIEKTVATVPFRQEYVNIDTTNILFIVGGAFVGLDVLVRTRLDGVDVGTRGLNELIKNILPSDLSRFGLIPEFVGRLPIIVGLNALDKQALSDILTTPKNALAEQYKKMFALDGIELVFEQEALYRIADIALELKTGARGLRTIMEDRMLDVMYKVPGQKNLCKVVITGDVITKTGKPIYEYLEPREEIELRPVPAKLSRNKSAVPD